jgi:hypothetical protein
MIISAGQTELRVVGADPGTDRGRAGEIDRRPLKGALLAGWDEFVI